MTGQDQKGTRQRLVEAALYLFWKQGYAATGVSEILNQAGANSGSFYYFFKTKEQLLRAVLTMYIETLDPVVMGPVFEAVADPVERVFGVLGFYRQNLVATGCTYGCPIGRLALEIDVDQTQVHRLIAGNFDGWISAVESCLSQAGDRLPAGTSPKALAGFVLTVMEGAVMRARAGRSLEPFDESVAQLRRYFELLLSNG